MEKRLQKFYIWKRVDETETEIGEYLYHYTNFEALKSILSNKQIWLTEYRQLNDKKEISLGLNIFKKILSNSSDIKCKNGLQTIEYINKNKVPIYFKNKYGYYEEKIGTDFNVFVLSLSLCKEENALPLWNQYAKRGCCIVFNFKKLRNTFFKCQDELIQILLPSIYCGGRMMYYNEKKDIFRLGNNQSISLTDLEKVELNIFLKGENNPFSYKTNDLHNIISFSSNLKRDTFSYEDEYRMSFFLFKNLITQKIRKIFSFKNDGKERLIMNIPSLDLIDEIILSPYIKDEEASEMEKQLSRFGIKISKSILTGTVK